MFVILWEFEVKPGCEKPFEDSYGPDGDWAMFFRRDTHYRETRLLRDAVRSDRYVTVDFWDSREAYAGYICENKPTRPSGGRSGCRNCLGVPDVRRTASADR